MTSDAELAARVRALGAEVRARARSATARIGAVSEDGLRASVEKMRSDGVADAAIRAFEHYYRQLEAGETGLVPEDSIEPVDRPAGRSTSCRLTLEAEREALQQAIVLRLNGGLGTSMGLTGAKSLLEAKDGLQLPRHHRPPGARAARRARRPAAARADGLLLHARGLAGRAAPRTRTSTSACRWTSSRTRSRSCCVDDLTPVEWPDDPALEWCPPGHGDLYTALVTSGMLEALLEQGFEYAFVANSDNLGAVLDPRILAWLRAEQIPFLMEVTDRTEADRKGGHLAKRREDGRLVLRETAQTPEEDLEALQDITRHRYVNTNNLWVDLRALDAAMRERDGVLGLPMIRNEKTVDPSDKSSPAVYQIETAMGAAIEVFEGARALRVPRTRFAPVKTTDDLLALRSDAYELTDDARVVLAGDRDERAVRRARQRLLQAAAATSRSASPQGPPSLVECDRFEVEGDVHFGAGRGRARRRASCAGRARSRTALSSRRSEDGSRGLRRGARSPRRGAGPARR